MPIAQYTLPMNVTLWFQITLNTAYSLFLHFSFAACVSKLNSADYKHTNWIWPNLQWCNVSFVRSFSIARCLFTIFMYPQGSTHFFRFGAKQSSPMYRTELVVNIFTTQILGWTTFCIREIFNFQNRKTLSNSGGSANYWTFCRFWKLNISLSPFVPQYLWNFYI